MKVTYQAKSYKPELVTGFYVRCMGQKPNFVFKIIEAASAIIRGEVKTGQGPTLREYETNGEELPKPLKERCIKTKVTERWNKENPPAPVLCGICHGTGYDKGTPCICND